MKYLIFSIFLMISCKINTNKVVEDDNASKVIQEQQSAFKKSLSANNAYTLYYKIEEAKGSPIKIFTYYVSDTQTNQVVKKSEIIAAEKMYWKDNNTLVIIPYVGIVQKETVVGEVEKNNEILIKIK